jgi:hypothetical protein
MMTMIIMMIIQIFIIYLPNQQLQSQLQTQHSVDTSNYITNRHDIKWKKITSKYWRKNTLMQKSKQTNKQTMMRGGNKNCITENIRNVNK